MVSKLQRHLSLLLVVVITSSWLVVPSALQAQNKTTSGSTTATSDPCKTGYNSANNATEKIFNHGLTTLPTFNHRCFVLDSKDNSITHKFNFYNNPASKDAIYEQRYVKAASPATAFAGCEIIDPSISTDCNKDKPNTYNYFTFLDAVTHSKSATGGGSNITYRWQTYSDKPVEVYYIDQHITQDGKIADPNRFLLVYNKGGQRYVYGFYEMNNARVQKASKDDREFDRKLGLTANEPAYTFYDFFFHNQRNVNANNYKNQPPFQYYAALVNGLGNVSEQRYSGRKPYSLLVAGQSAPSSSSGSETTSEDAEKTLTTASEIFADVNINHIHLHDYTDASGKEDSSKPPIIDILPGGTPIGKTISFQFSNALFKSSSSTRNNYFLFKLAAEPSTIASEMAPINRELFFLVVDGAGNMGFVVNDPSKEGGIFSPTRLILDDFLLYKEKGSPFDISNVNKGVNSKGDKFHFNAVADKMEDFRAVITRRVYNEPADRGASVVCKGSLSENQYDYSLLVLYPKTNSGYDNDPSRFPNKIPQYEHRQCINGTQKAGAGTGTDPDNHPPGWLVQWGVSLVDIEQPTGDNVECLNYFGGDTWYNFAGKSICWVLGIIIGGAVNFAGFSVELLIEAAGLQ